MRSYPTIPHGFHDYPEQLKGLFWAPIQGFANAFQINHLRVICDANHEGWEHVSVSTASRTPTWQEMEFVKRSFWWPHETVMQLHVPEAEHVNFMPHCLHLWAPGPMFPRIPRPPNHLVGGWP